jgi:hypothetical protein
VFAHTETVGAAETLEMEEQPDCRVVLRREGGEGALVAVETLWPAGGNKKRAAGNPLSADGP